MDKSSVGDLAVKQRSLTYMVKLVRNNQQIHFRTSLHNFHQYWVWIPNPSEYQRFLPSAYFYDLLCGKYFKGTEFVEEFTIYLHSNFHLDVALFTFFFRRGCGFLAPVAYYLHHEIKEKYLVHSDVMFLYIEKKNSHVNKICILFEDVIQNKISESRTCGAEVALGSNIYKAAMFI